MSTPVSDALRKEIAPSGTLRVGVNHQNFLLVLPGYQAPNLRGPAPDLAREIGHRLNLPIEFVGFQTAGALADGVGTDAWDVAFLAAEPQRAGQIAFSPPYLQIPASYLVPAGSTLLELADVDREGVRISAAAKSAYELYLRRSLKHATLVTAPSVDASFDLFVNDRLDALSGLVPRLLKDVQKLPGARILDGQFTAVQQAVGTHPNRLLAVEFLKELVTELCESGFVKDSIRDNGVTGVTVG